MLRMPALALLCVGWTSVCVGGGLPKPETVLKRVFQRSFAKSFVQIAVINNFETFGESITMKIDATADGWTKYTCTQPASAAGIVSIDDGRSWKQYEPDKGTFISVPSSRLQTLPVDERIKLIVENYRLSISANGRILSLATYRIDAEPRREDLPQRTFWVEQETLAPLRYIMEGDDFRRKSLLDTLKFEVQKVSRSGPPERADGKPWKQEKMEAAVSLRSVEEGIRRLKLPVKFPRKLPFGFKVQNVQVVGTGAVKMLSIRMTDGLAFASLYIGPSSAQLPSSWGKDHVVGITIRNLTYQLRSDLPGMAAQDLLESIIDPTEWNDSGRNFFERNRSSIILDRPFSGAENLRGSITI